MVLPSIADQKAALIGYLFTDKGVVGA